MTRNRLQDRVRREARMLFIPNRNSAYSVLTHSKYIHLLYFLHHEYVSSDSISTADGNERKTRSIDSKAIARHRVGGCGTLYDTAPSFLAKLKLTAAQQQSQIGARCDFRCNFHSWRRLHPHRANFDMHEMHEPATVTTGHWSHTFYSQWYCYSQSCYDCRICNKW